jgi:2-oxo-4-hydroxy-4-carboxy--5-ureidoimidazoline (OHCU) decarboxylase
VFVNRRPKSEIVPILRERLERTREQELATALEELVSIAEDRWRHS